MKKVAFITGATGGIGEAIADNFVKQGYQVALIDISAKKLAEQAKHLTNKYQLDSKETLPLIYDIDIADNGQVKVAVEKLISQFKRIDVLFNGAATNGVGANAEELLKVNLLGTFNCIHEIAPIMKKQNSGYIFNVASQQGRIDNTNLVSQENSKTEVVGLTLKELVTTGVKVTALYPSYTNTCMADLLDFPREEMLSPEDIVKTVNYLLSLSTPACIREVLIETRKLLS